MRTRTQQLHAYVWGQHRIKGRLGLGDALRHNETTHVPTKITAGNIDWVQIASGPYHMVGLSRNGEVFTWGSGWCGKLGHGDYKERDVPRKVQYLSNERIVKVACGDQHTAALAAGGKLFTWYVIKTPSDYI